MLPELTILASPMSKQLVATAYEVFRELIIPPSLFYVPLDLLRDGTAAESLADYLPPPVSAFLARHLRFLMGVCPATALAIADGFELWLGVTARTGDTAYLHIDNDETLRSRTGEIRCPLMGTIFHLGPSCGLVGGETLFDLEPSQTSGKPHHPFMRDKWESILAHTSAPILVPQRSGWLILFRGDLPHAIAPIRACDPYKPRVALLANLWDRRIVSVPTGVTSLSAKTDR